MQKRKRVSTLTTADFFAKTCDIVELFTIIFSK